MVRSSFLLLFLKKTREPPPHPSPDSWSPKRVEEVVWRLKTNTNINPTGWQERSTGLANWRAILRDIANLLAGRPPKASPRNTAAKELSVFLKVSALLLQVSDAQNNRMRTEAGRERHRARRKEETYKVFDRFPKHFNLPQFGSSVDLSSRLAGWLVGR